MLCLHLLGRSRVLRPPGQRAVAEVGAAGSESQFPCIRLRSQVTGHLESL